MERRSSIIIILIIAVMAVFTAVFFAVDNIDLKKRIHERDAYIESFVQGDTTIVRERIETQTTFMVGTKEMNADEFVDYVNKLRLEYIVQIDSLDYYRRFYKMVCKDFGFNFSSKVSQDSTKVEYLLSYPHGIKDVDQLSRDHFLLNEVVKKYDIVIEEGDGFYVISSEKIDSALVLLPYYRDRIKKTDDGKAWAVSIR